MNEGRFSRVMHRKLYLVLFLSSHKLHWQCTVTNRYRFDKQNVRHIVVSLITINLVCIGWISVCSCASFVVVIRTKKL